MPIGHFPQQILSSFQIPRSTNQSSQKVSNFKTSQLVELPLDLSHPRFLYHLNHLPKSPTESWWPQWDSSQPCDHFGGNVHPNSSKFGARSPIPTRPPVIHFLGKKKLGYNLVPIRWGPTDKIPKIVRSLAATESWACCVRFCKAILHFSLKNVLNS